MSYFNREFEKLNKLQKLAVNTIEGPLLVLAGPGTGKTQIISARVARILKKTDTPAQNILCLTFTENGATNMRERLTRFIGQDAHNVNISTYHAFGSDLIKRFPEYSNNPSNRDPVDDIGRYQIVLEINDKLSYSNKLKSPEAHLEKLVSILAEVKRALLTGEDLRKISKQNLKFITKGSIEISRIFSGMTRMPSKLDKALSYFSEALSEINRLSSGSTDTIKGIIPIANIASRSLELAIEESEAINKTTPLTAWKNKWLAKDSLNNFCIAGLDESQKLEHLADILEEYQNVLAKRGLYDYEDMIIQSIRTLQQNQDLKFTLQEQYLYILLDEFQDTNASQLELIRLLCDSPVNEGRPNVMAVGDDDQAIYSFQGAQHSNMLDFYNMFRDVTVVSLNENYRSHTDIIHVSKNVSDQISDRLHHNFPKVSKDLIASADSLPDKCTILRNDFVSEIAQYDWISGKINELIKKGVNPREIAILAPRHAQLEPIVPYLNTLNIPARYEKRENILEASVVRQLISMSRLVQAIANNQTELASSLWVEVLSFDFWAIPVRQIWEMSWKVNDSRNEPTTWNKLMFAGKNLQEPAAIFFTLAGKVNNEPLENMLDLLIGTEEIPTPGNKLKTVRSPLRDFYTNTKLNQNNPQIFYETVSNLKVLRDKLRTHQGTLDRALYLSDFIAYVDLYYNSGQKLINTSPYNQNSNAVQIMTVYKAKGLEFEHVFLPSCSDEVWGESARSGNNKVSLPANLLPIRYAGTSEDERLRLLFVALSRAKHGLYLTFFKSDYTGNAPKRLKYLNEIEQEDGSFISAILPPHFQAIYPDDHEKPDIKLLDLDWKTKHKNYSVLTSLKQLLKHRIEDYRISPTHLNKFIDTRYGGPETFFFDAILRFPQAPSDSSQFGSIMHVCLEWLQHQTEKKGKMPKISEAKSEFARQLRLYKLPKDHEKLELERGELALTEYLKQRGHIFKPNDIIAEFNFYKENIVINGVKITGKIDRLEIDKKTKRITVVDYKTGKSYNSWKSNVELHKYSQQLYFYKLLVENSRTFSGYKVDEARLEFVQPDKNNHIQVLNLKFDEKEVKRVKELISCVWNNIMDLNFPSIESYPPTLKGIREFENFLLSDNS